MKWSVSGDVAHTGSFPLTWIKENDYSSPNRNQNNKPLVAVSVAMCVYMYTHTHTHTHTRTHIHTYMHDVAINLAPLQGLLQCICPSGSLGDIF